jgi:hypothetical protein
LIPALVGSALLIAVTTGAATGFGYAPRELAPAASALLLIATSEWPASEYRARNAVLLACATTAIAWLAIEAVPS